MSEETKAQKRPGRRPKVAGDLKNSSLTFRTRAGMREKLEASAKARDLSISEEVERRILLSFDLASSPANEYIIRSIADSLNFVENFKFQKWTDSAITAYMCFSAMQHAASAVLANHDLSCMDDDFKQKVDRAGAITGIRSAMLNAGLPLEDIINVGREDINEYMFASVKREALAEALASALPSQTEKASQVRSDPESQKPETSTPAPTRRKTRTRAKV